MQNIRKRTGKNETEKREPNKKFELESIGSERMIKTEEVLRRETEPEEKSI